MTKREGCVLVRFRNFHVFLVGLIPSSCRRARAAHILFLSGRTGTFVPARSAFARGHQSNFDLLRSRRRPCCPPCLTVPRDTFYSAVEGILRALRGRKKARAGVRAYGRCSAAEIAIIQKKGCAPRPARLRSAPTSIAPLPWVYRRGQVSIHGQGKFW